MDETEGSYQPKNETTVEESGFVKADREALLKLREIGKEEYFKQCEELAKHIGNLIAENPEKIIQNIKKRYPSPEMAEGDIYNFNMMVHRLKRVLDQEPDESRESIHILLPRQTGVIGGSKFAMELSARAANCYIDEPVYYNDVVLGSLAEQEKKLVDLIERKQWIEASVEDYNDSKARIESLDIDPNNFDIFRKTDNLS